MPAAGGDWIGLKVEAETLQQNWDATLLNKVLQFQQAEENEMKERLCKLKEDIAITEAKQEVYEDELLVSAEGNERTKPPIRTRKRSSSFTHVSVGRLQEDGRIKAKSMDRKERSKKANVHSSVTGLFVTRQFVNPTFCQKLRNIVSGRLMRHFVTRQFITTKKFTNDNLSPSRQFVTRQFVTMTICHDRRLTTTATFSHTTICHNHFYWRQFVTPNNLDVF